MLGSFTNVMRFLLAPVLVLSLCVGAAAEPSTPDAGPPSVSASLPLTAEALESRVELVEADESLEEAVRTEAVRRYREALEQLAAAADLDEKAAEFLRAGDDASARLESLDAELAEPIVDERLELPDGIELRELETRLTDANASLAAQLRAEAQIADEQRQRVERRTEIPGDLTEIEQELAALVARLQSVERPAEDDDALMAVRAEQLSRRVLLEASVRVGRAELRSYDARRDLLPARKELAARRTAALQRSVAEIQNRVNLRRRADAEQAAQEAADVRHEIADQHPMLARLAQQVSELAELRTGENGLAVRIERGKGQLTSIGTSLAALKEHSRATREKAAAAGFNQAIGLLLLSQRNNLPPIDVHVTSIRRRREEIANVQLAALELEEERAASIHRRAELLRLVGEMDPDSVDPNERTLIDTGEGLLDRKREILDSALRDYELLLLTLVDLDAAERSLINATRAYRQFIDENVLWIRGRSALSVEMLEDAVDALAWLLDPVNLRSLLTAANLTFENRPFLTIALALGLLITIVISRRLRKSIGTYAAAARAETERSVAASFQLLVATIAIALPPPLIAHFLAWLITGVSSAGTGYTASVASGFRQVATTYFFFELARQICRKEGLAEVYLGWSRERWLVRVRRNVPWALLLGLPALFVTTVMNVHGTQRWVDSLGRISMVETLLVVAALAFAVLRRARLEESPLAGRKMTTVIRRWLYFLLPGVWVLLALLALFGWEYASLRLSERVMQTVWVGLVILLINSMATKWILAARRRLAIEQARKRRQAIAQQARAGDDPGMDVESAVVDDGEIDLTAINEQTRRLLRSALTFGFLVTLWLIWLDVFPALKVFERIELWSIAEKDGTSVPITLDNVLRAFIIVVITVGGARNIPGFLEITILQRLPLEPSIRYAITAVSRYAIVVVGMIGGFGALRIGWSQVQFLAAAVSVGLGFGLQEIFANFVSGLIILFERPVRVGDTVTLGELRGTVARIRMRATTIVDWDRRELIVPNKEFITGQLINWSLSDPILRLVIPVGIAYGSDTRKADELLMKVAEDCEYVMSDPPASVVFREFGESSLDFHLRVFIPSMDYYWRTQNALHVAIDDAFREAEIEIAFPQRDLHMRASDRPLRVQIESGPEPEKE